jgi:hypothetical protein
MMAKPEQENQDCRQVILFTDSPIYGCSTLGTDQTILP